MRRELRWFSAEKSVALVTVFESSKVQRLERSMPEWPGGVNLHREIGLAGPGLADNNQEGFA
jgi:hypothetical protein